MTDGQKAFYQEHFERCWPWLDAAVRVYGDKHSKEDVWSEVEREHAQFWPWPNSAHVTQITEGDPKELRWWLAGGDMAELLHHQPMIEEFARSVGCQRAVIVGRRGWLRAAPEFRELATIMAKDL